MILTLIALAAGPRGPEAEVGPIDYGRDPLLFLAVPLAALMLYGAYLNWREAGARPLDDGTGPAETPPAT